MTFVSLFRIMQVKASKKLHKLFNTKKNGETETKRVLDNFTECLNYKESSPQLHRASSLRDSQICKMLSTLDK